MRSWICLLMLGCGGGGSYQGRLVDGLTEVPKESVRVVAKTIDQTNDLTCMARESTTTGQGVFTRKDLCRGLRYGL